MGFACRIFLPNFLSDFFAPAHSHLKTQKKQSGNKSATNRISSDHACFRHTHAGAPERCVLSTLPCVLMCTVLLLQLSSCLFGVAAGICFRNAYNIRLGRRSAGRRMRMLRPAVGKNMKALDLFCLVAFPPLPCLQC